MLGPNGQEPRGDPAGRPGRGEAEHMLQDAITHAKATGQQFPDPFRLEALSRGRFLVSSSKSF